MTGHSLAQSTPGDLSELSPERGSGDGISKLRGAANVSSSAELLALPPQKALPPSPAGGEHI
jgi:hypothetical protein